MATFRVGQRVRKVRGKRGIGSTAVVLDFHPISDNPKVDFRIVHEQDWIDDGGHQWRAGDWGNSCTDQWEPVVSDRNQTVEWSECLWQPEHMRQQA